MQNLASLPLELVAELGAGDGNRTRMNVHGKHVPHQSASPAMERVTGIEPANICLEGSVLTIEETPASEPPLGIEPSPLPYRGSAPP